VVGRQGPVVESFLVHIPSTGVRGEIPRVVLLPIHRPDGRW
jgi:hypothetical protein